MSIFKLLSEGLWTETDLDLRDETGDEGVDLGDEELSLDGEGGDISDEEPTDDSGKGDAKSLVDAMVKYAPGTAKEIKNMLKYAANSNQEYDIWDSALDYFESIEDTLDIKDREADVAPEEEIDPDTIDTKEF